ncbi:hypothetical protein [Parasitella parasitica]|uniref:Uncharacterized protein n=1 Tax=Parasitella parasitica TaxID=35722 RepID=A0A0B7MMH2_9FUNG|nr:hypothetical protein [Parasitella parasitica]
MNSDKFLLAIFLLQHWNEDNALGADIHINFERGDRTELARDVLEKQLLIQRNQPSDNTEPVLNIAEAAAGAGVGRRRLRIGKFVHNEEIHMNPRLPQITVAQLNDEAILDDTPLANIVPIVLAKQEDTHRN